MKGSIQILTRQSHNIKMTLVINMIAIHLLRLTSTAQISRLEQWLKCLQTDQIFNGPN